MRQSLSTLEYKALKSVRLPKLRLTTTARQDVISLRRNKVNQLRLLGYTCEQIATQLRCSLSTIEKDLHLIREKSKSWFRNDSIKDYCASIYDCVCLCDIKIEELQLLYKVEENPKKRTLILDEIRKTVGQKTKLYEKTKAVQRFLIKKEVTKLYD